MTSSFGTSPGSASSWACVPSKATGPDWGVGRFFLARTLLESGDLNGAKTEALKGLDLDAKSEFAALGHYVLADVYERQGQRALAAAEGAGYCRRNSRSITSMSDMFGLHRLSDHGQTAP